MRSVVVVGGGLGGLAAAALLGRAGLRVTLLEGAPYLGGKSRRLALKGQRINTGPEFLTFLERVMNLGKSRIEMRISRSAWFPRDLCFPHS